MTDILLLPVQLQIALAGGYMGYVTAYTGLRSGHKAWDALLLTLVFGAIPALAWPALLDLLGLDGNLWFWVVGLGALLVSVLLGAFWRAWGRKLWYHLLHILGLHKDDGLATAWESLSQNPDTIVTQIMVRTTDGTELFCENALAHIEQAEKCGQKAVAEEFNPRLGTDGAITMIVDTRKSPGQDEISCHIPEGSMAVF